MSEFDGLIRVIVMTVLMMVAYFMGRGDGWKLGFEDGRKYGYELCRLLDEACWTRAVIRSEVPNRHS